MSQERLNGNPIISDEELSELGSDEVGYIRKFSRDELVAQYQERFPEAAADIAENADPNALIYVLSDAAGRPLAVSDDESVVRTMARTEFDVDIHNVQ